MSSPDPDPDNNPHDVFSRPLASPGDAPVMKAPPPRQAATVVLLRDVAAVAGGQSFEVLMVKRNRGASFMADAHVFPGGKLEPADNGDFTVAAARESFEEAGVLLAVDAAGQSARTDGEPWAEEARRAMERGELAFGDLLQERGYRVSPDLVYFANWVTPPTESRRFDARFFLGRMPPHQAARADLDGEVVEHLWATPAALLDAQCKGEIKLAPPTINTLTGLAALPSSEAALAWARSRVIQPIRPKLIALDGTLMILLPWDAAYAAAPVDEGEPIAATHPVAGPVTRYVLDDGRWVGKAVP